MQVYDKIQESLAYIHTKTKFQPKTGIILGTGLSNLVADIDIECSIPYSDIPHFPISTVQSHKGELVFGYLSGQPIVAMAGRFHYYEGYSMQQVTFPVRVLKFLGVQQLFISNAAGSTNANIETGDLVVIKDHINLQPENPLRGVNDERLGPRFPDMLQTYKPSLRRHILRLAQTHTIRIHEGVYVGLQGPNLETPAEYNYLHTIGGDVVGMSTVPEVLVARHMNLPVLVVSVVSNKCYPIEELTATTVEEVITAVEAVAPKLQLLIRELLKQQ